MLVDAVRRGGGALPRTLGDLPDVVRGLLTRTLDEVPGPRHRLALEVCAHANVITETVLRSVLGDEAGELFTWLRTLSFVEEGPYGLFLHDMVRDALDADLRWRDPGATPRCITRYAPTWSRGSARRRTHGSSNGSWPTPSS
jgi:hypothetical protein